MTEPLAFDPIAEARRQWEWRWPEASATMAAATSVIRAQQIVLNTVDAVLRPFSLTFARYEALAMLSFTRHGEMPLGKMGQRLMIHPTSVTNIIDRLCEDGLVNRVAHPTDRRTTLAVITEEGRALAAKASEAVNGVRFGLGELDADQLSALTAIVTELRRRTGDFTDPD